MSSKLNITVMLGGFSAEREVSLNTGTAAAKALRSLGHTVRELDPKDEHWTLLGPTDVVFLALHGTYGEDGQVQAKLEQLGVPYTGCGPEASRLAFDKLLTKQRCVEAGVPTAKFVVVRTSMAELISWPAGTPFPWPEHLAPPVVIKPVCQGSSVGLQFVDRREDFLSALRDAVQYDNRLLMEERIVGRETTVAILDGEALPVVEVRPKAGAYDYTNKYTAGKTDYFCPAPFDPPVTAAIQNAALGAFSAVGGRDYARVDVMVRESGEPVVLEVNTLPGMTETSLLPKAAAAAGIGYAELCQRMVDLAMMRKGRNTANAQT